MFQIKTSLTQLSFQLVVHMMRTYKWICMDKLNDSSLQEAQRSYNTAAITEPPSHRPIRTPSSNRTGLWKTVHCLHKELCGSSRQKESGSEFCPGCPSRDVYWTWMAHSREATSLPLVDNLLVIAISFSIHSSFVINMDWALLDTDVTSTSITSNWHKCTDAAAKSLLRKWS